MDVTIQVEDAAFARFKALCEAMGIAPGDYVEGIVSSAIDTVTDEISSILNRHLQNK